MANLILSRKAGESIVIGEDGDIVVTIQSVRGGTVDVRIAAPRDVSVHRDEIYAKLHPDAVPEAVASGEAAAERARQPRIYLRRRHHRPEDGVASSNTSHATNGLGSSTDAVAEADIGDGDNDNDGDVNGNR